MSLMSGLILGNFVKIFQKIKKSDTVLSGLFCIIDFAELEYLVRNVPDG